MIKQRHNMRGGRDQEVACFNGSCYKPYPKTKSALRKNSRRWHRPPSASAPWPMSSSKWTAAHLHQHIRVGARQFVSCARPTATTINCRRCSFTRSGAVLHLLMQRQWPCKFLVLAALSAMWGVRRTHWLAQLLPVEEEIDAAKVLRLLTPRADHWK